MIAQDDDSISLKWNDSLVGMGDHQVRALNAVAPWNTVISRPLLWAWIMFNQQGYFDGLRFEFAETTEAPVSRIQLLVVGSEFKYQAEAEADVANQRGKIRDLAKKRPL